MKILVFDFDGVLAIPFTTPPIPFPGVIDLLKYLYKNNDTLLFLASFNAGACQALHAWGVAHFFSSMRYGSNDTWDPPYLPEYGIGTTKSGQISSMLLDLNRKVPINRSLFFFDDMEENIINVALSGIGVPVLVSSLRGISSDDILNPRSIALNVHHSSENMLYNTIVYELSRVIQFSQLGIIISYGVFNTI
jgi:hypothetical protein